MIFKVIGGVPTKVGEVNAIDKINGITPLEINTDKSVLVDGSKIAWSNTESTKSVTNKFNELTLNFNDLAEYKDDIDNLQIDVNNNKTILEYIKTKLTTDSNFLDFDDNGLHSELSLNYDSSTGMLSLRGKTVEGEIQQVGDSIDLELESDIHWVKVHHRTTTEGVTTWIDSLPADAETTAKTAATEDGPYLVVGYTKHADSGVKYTFSLLTSLVDTYTAGNGVSLDVDSKTFSANVGAGLKISEEEDPKEKKIIVNLAENSGLKITNGKIYFDMNEVDSVTDIPSGTLAAPDGTMYCIVEE